MSAKSDYVLTPAGVPATVGQREERATRELALSLAVSVAAGSSGGMYHYEAETLVNAAKAFEAYLKGDKDAPGDDE